MKTMKIIVGASLCLLLIMSSSPSLVKWDFLGQRKVNYSLDRDEISVTAREGTFRKIKLKVKRAPVHFNKVIIHYRNGSKETVKMKANIGPGGETRAIDINGGKRIIHKVVFYYNSKQKFNKKGLVKLYGLH